jgi:diguanylate cyclase (GGDEF)-like protein
MQFNRVLSMHVAARGLLIFVPHVLGWLFVAYLIWPGGGPTLIWPPAGVAFAGLLLFGLRYWPFVALACLFVELAFGSQAWTNIPFAVIGPTLGAAAGVHVAQRLAGQEIVGLSVRDLWSLLVGALVLGVVSGLIGTSGAWLTGSEVDLHPIRYWSLWVLGDLFGIVVCTPAMLLTYHVHTSGQLSPLGTPYGGLRERLAWSLAMLLALWLLIGYGVRAAAPVQGLAFLPVALLAWSALRLEPVFTGLAVALLGLAVAAMSSLGLAGFETPQGLFDSALVALFVAVLAALPHLLCAAEYERRVLLRQLAEKAHRDDLTGLYNRNGFQFHLERLLRNPATRGEKLALVHVDLDQFKLINDACGATEGDVFLAQLASVIKAHSRPDDLLARIGGDEFVQVWRNTDQASADRRASDLLRMIEAFRFPQAGRVMSLTASVGLVCVVVQYQTVSQLQREATIAVQTAKEQGGNRIKRVVGLDQELRQRKSAMQWAVKLSGALEEERFRLFAQRIVPLRSGGESGAMFEVLLRMDDGQGGLLLPGRFIPAAERFGQAARLDRHVLRMALGWFSQRRELRDRVGRMSVNLSAASLSDEELLPYLLRLLEETGFPPEKLCLEITETDAIRDLARTRALMEGLRVEGVRFALDDFGSGFCSFGYLRTLPVDYIKIDGSFVRDLADDPGDRAIVRAIVEVSKSLGKQTVAECVESEAARVMVAALEVDYAQGFALHRPEALESLLDTRKLAAVLP